MSVLSCIRVFNIIVIAVLLANIKTVFASPNAANVCLNLFTENQGFNVGHSLKIESVKILKRIGQGTEASVFKTKFDNKMAVFRYLDSVNPESKSYLLSQLTVDQRSALAKMDENNAYQIAAVDISDQPSAFEIVQNQIARMIVTSVESQKMSVLIYRGHTIVPKIFGYVRNVDGIIVGQIQEYVPGKTLIAKLDNMTKAQEREIYNQIIDQVRILSSHGYFHGDLDTDTNIMVSRSRNGVLTARLIDFDPYRMGRRDPKEVSNREIELLIYSRDFE